MYIQGGNGPGILITLIYPNFCNDVFLFVGYKNFGTILRYEDEESRSKKNSDVIKMRDEERRSEKENP